MSPPGGCGAPDQDADVAVPAGATVITGRVQSAGAPLPSAFVRLLDSSGEFVAEVVASQSGAFRFYAAPGTWTVKVLARAGTGESAVTADTGVNQVTVSVA
ncbi:MAG: DUF1416 domain-containing protein [Mycobacteriales bacterium]